MFTDAEEEMENIDIDLSDNESEGHESEDD